MSNTPLGGPIWDSRSRMVELEALAGELQEGRSWRLFTRAPPWTSTHKCGVCRRAARGAMDATKRPGDQAPRRIALIGSCNVDPLTDIQRKEAHPSATLSQAVAA